MRKGSVSDERARAAEEPRGAGWVGAGERVGAPVKKEEKKRPGMQSTVLSAHE